jgi:lipoic acid synthetase
MNPLKKKPRTTEISLSPEKPEWMKVSVQFPLEDNSVSFVRNNVESNRLHTVCESASCPNLNHCWSRKTATFMLSGDICTRRCGYCDVAFGKPLPLDLDEPNRIAESVRKLGLKHVVLTAVNRDDLQDGGANNFAETVKLIKCISPECKIEVLIPDFKGKQESLDILYASKPDIINHNIETVNSLFRKITPQKNYETSLRVLRNISESGFVTKSGLILGMGENIGEVKTCIRDLWNVGVIILTIGQYLQPTPTHYALVEFIKPEIFYELKEFALNLGFMHVESGPLVRSSYHADVQMVINDKNKNNKN